MSHYPSSAELAAFRRATHDANIASVERVTGRPTMTFVHPSASPAWPSERKLGIGKFLQTVEDGYRLDFKTPVVLADE